MPILSAFGAAKTLGGPGASVGPYEGYAYEFNSASLVYPISSAFSIGVNNFSIECFVYIDAYPVTGRDVIMDFGFALAGRIQFYLTTLGRIALVRDNNPGTTIVASTNAVPLSTWTYIAVTRVSGTVYVFIGSTLDGSGSMTQSLTTGSETPSIGNGSRSPYNASYFDGKISNLRFNVGSGFTSVTVPTQPLTAQATTKILTCQSSTVKDNSVANGGGPWTVTNNGVIVSASGPF